MRNNKGQFMKGHQELLGKKKLPFSEEHRKNISKASIGNRSRTGQKNSPESNEKRRRWSLKHGFQKREKHPNWVNGNYKKRQERNDSAYVNWSKSVKKRDKYTCKINNDNCSGILIAHHILGWALHPELRYEINNGITLCKFHHPLKRKEEQNLIPFFRNLIDIYQ